MSNEGNVYVTGRIFEKGKTYPKEFSDEIVLFTEKGKTVKTIPIKLENKKWSIGKLLVNHNQNLIYSGFYNDDELKKDLGTYYFKLDINTSKLINSSTTPFNFDFIIYGLDKNNISIKKKRLSKGKEIGFNAGAIDTILPLNDGGIYLISEYTGGKNYAYRSDASFNSTVYSYQSFSKQDATVIKINEKGVVEWERKIVKYQKINKTKNNLFGQGFFISNNKLFTFHNDDPKNLLYQGIGNGTLYTSKGKSVVIGVIIHPDGSGFDKREAWLLGGKDGINYKVIPSTMHQVDNDNILIWGKHKKLTRVINFKPQ